MHVRNIATAPLSSSRSMTRSSPTATGHAGGLAPARARPQEGAGPRRSLPMQLTDLRHAPTAACVGAALAALCFSAIDAEQRPSAPAAAAPVTASDIAALAADSRSWLGLDREPRLRGVPCMSAAEDADLRLAYVFARDPAAYLGLESGAPQHDQALVLATYDAERWTAPGPGRPPEYAVAIDGAYYVGGAPREQLVLAREAEGPWTFGIVEGDGSVREAGTNIKLCLRCHANAPYERLFGLESDGGRKAAAPEPQRER